MTTPKKMNPEIKARWLAALRSGEYIQGHQRLRDGDGYCCLGVLCEIAVADGIVQREGDEGYVSVENCGDSSNTHLPISVASWASVDFMGDIARIKGEACPDAGDDPHCGNPGCARCDIVRLVELNDEKGYSFEQIAEVIEKWL